MQYKVSELEGEALDRAVAKAQGGREMAQRSDGLYARFLEDGPAVWKRWNPSGDWAQGGPIIEREEISVLMTGGYPCAYVGLGMSGGEIDGYAVSQSGPTVLVAAMRAFVCYHAPLLGETVELP